MKKQMSPEQREARIEHRATVRNAIAEKRDKLRQWRQARIAQAEKLAEAKRKGRQVGSRGVDRVPAHLHGAEITVEPHMFGKRDVDRVRPLAQLDDLHPSGNHAERRAAGQRGHQRKPRTRELPGAVERRLERKRKAWLA